MFCARSKRKKTEFRALNALCLAVACVVFAAEASDITQTAYTLAPLSQPIVSASSTRVSGHVQDNARPYLGAESLNTHNFRVRILEKPESNWNDKRLTIELNNQGQPPSATACKMTASAVELCEPAKVEEARTHPLFAGAKIHRIGPFEIALLAPSQMCKETTSCKVTLPSAFLNALAQGRDTDLPRFITALLLKDSLSILDAERGGVLWQLDRFPEGISSQQLGPIVSMTAEHRGQLVIKFLNAVLRINGLNETALFFASGARVWTGAVRSHTSDWRLRMPEDGGNVQTRCDGTPLHVQSNRALYTNCLIQLDDSTKIRVFPLATRIQAVAEAIEQDHMKVWFIQGKTIKIANLHLTSDTATLSSESEMPFYGRSPSEIQLFADRAFRITSDGFYLVNARGEEKTSLPYSPKRSYLSHDGRHVLLSSKDARGQCVFKHLKAKVSEPRSWEESGLSFSCESTYVNPHGRGLTVTRISGRSIQVIDTIE